MNPTIKARIESIRRGEVPEGYKRTKIGIVPNEWGVHALSEHLIESRILGSNGRVAKKLTVKLWNKGVSQKKEVHIGSENTIYYRRKAGQLIYSKLDFLNCAFGIIPKELDNYESTLDLPCFDIENVNSYFLLSYITQKRFYAHFGMIADGGRKARRVSPEEMLKFPLIYPPLKEQENIAEVLAGQDRVIELKEKLLAEKQKQKKYLMQQLLTGKKRLPGFSGEWKMFLLGDFGKCIRGVSYDPKRDIRAEEDNETIQLLRANNINDGEVNFQNIYYVSKKIVSDEKIIRNGDILISMSSGSKVAVGKSAQVKSIEKSSCVGAFCAIYRSKYNNYIIQIFLSEVYKRNLFLLLEGSNINNLNNSDIENLCFIFPKEIEEQTAIAEILSAADKEIELLKKDIEQEKLKKKSLMQLLLTGIVRVNV